MPSASLLQRLMFVIAVSAVPLSAGYAQDSPKMVDLSGQALDKNEKPVADANVLVIYKTWRGRYRQQSLTARTDKDGKFSFSELYRTGEQTAFLVTIVKSGFALQSEYVLNKAGKKLPPFNFKLTSAKPMKLQLVDGSGEPLAGVPVSPKGRETPSADRHFLYHLSAPAIQARTDADGKVDLSYFLPNDQAAILLWINGKSTDRDFRVKDAAEHRLAIEVEKQEGKDLAGNVVDDGGKAVAGADVLLIYKSWPGGRYQQQALKSKTDQDGNFKFANLYQSGKRTAFLVTLLKDGYSLQSQYVPNLEGDDVDFQFKLDKADPLRVQLVDKDGKPLAKAVVIPVQRKTFTGDEFFIYSQSGPDIARRADADGKIDLNYFRRGDSASILVVHDGVRSPVSFQVGDDKQQTVKVTAAKQAGDTPRRWVPEATEATPEQVAWMGKAAIRLRSIDPADEDFSDLAPLKKLIGDARIVQLGEQSHGDGTCFETKTRLIKFLHQEMGFDVLAFESGLFDCRKAWRAYQQGTDPHQAARQGIFGIWTDSRQVQPLIKYLAARADSEQPLELCGFDCQFTAQGSRQHLVKDLQALIDDLKITTPAAEEIRLVYRQLGQLLKYEKEIDGELETFLGTLSALEEALSKTKGSSKQQATEVRFWKQNLSSIKAHASNKWHRTKPNVNARDAQMAKNLIWLANDLYKDRKIIVWAASFHIARNLAEVEVPDGSLSYKETTPMGHRVAEQLGDAVFTVGFTAYDGRAGAYFRLPFEIGKAPEGTLEGICDSAGLVNAIVPLRDVGGGGDWLNEKQFSRPLGYKWMKARWPRHFDAMVFNRQMQPSSRSASPSAR